MQLSRDSVSPGSENSSALNCRDNCPDLDDHFVIVNVTADPEPAILQCRHPNHMGIASDGS
jgi:hypothetical protein